MRGQKSERAVIHSCLARRGTGRQAELEAEFITEMRGLIVCCEKGARRKFCVGVQKDDAARTALGRG